MKVTVMLRHNHEVLRGLIDKWNSGTRKPNDKSVIHEMKRELQMHSRMASDVFYSALAATPSDKVAELVTIARKRCELLDRLFQELSAMNPTEHAIETKMNKAISEIGQHIEMEEDVLFHEARKAFPEYRLEELGLEMQVRRNSMRLAAAV